MLIEHAEELVCPFINTDHPYISDHPNIPDWVYCLTTKCMAWKSTTTAPAIYGEPCIPTGYCKRLGED